MFTDDMTLGTVKSLVSTGIQIPEGIDCPACFQRAKMYHRKVNSAMARTLIEMLNAGAEHSFVHTPSLPGDTHEASQLSWWGLILEEKRLRPDGGRAGYWRLTPKGVQWVRDEITIPKYASVYDGELVQLDGPDVTIREALGEKFDYGELMSV